MIGKLGKLPPRHDRRTLRLADYLRRLPTPPKERSWSAKAAPQWGMMRNDVLGDCTVAAIGHAIQVWTANTAHEITPPDDVILKAYEQACGYDPSDPGSDQGGVELDVLSYWRKTGVPSVGIEGVRIDGYACCEPRNHDHVRATIDLFGVAYIGLALPATAGDQVGKVWSVVDGPGSEPGSWGGHAVVLCDYDALGLTCVTWGALQRMTWAWLDRYCDEAYAVLCSQLWTPAGTAPNHFDLEALRRDLWAIGAVPKQEVHSG